MIYLFIILFCLNASAVWSVALLLAERNREPGMVERWVLSSELTWVSHTTEDEAWKSNQPNENLNPIRILVPAATVMLTLDNEE